MAEARAVAVTMSPLLRDIVMTVLSYHVAVELVAVFDTRAESEKGIEDIDPDLVFIGLQPGESDEITSTVLTRLPSARVVAFSHDGRHVSVHEFRADRKTFPDASPQDVVEVILGTWASRKI